MFALSGMSCENYTNTLNGWAANVNTPDGVDFRFQTNMVYGDPSSLNGRTILMTASSATPILTVGSTTLYGRGWIGNSGATVSNFFGDNVSSCAGTIITVMEILPVTFGNINAIIKDGQLQLNFSTLTETNNNRFEIEASKDGNNFVKIGELKTKAENGNSTAEINYSFSKEVAGVSGLLGISMFALAIGFMKRKKLSYVFIACGLLILFAGAACNKKENPLQTEKDGKIFIRIKQIDTDGNYQYSKIVQATPIP
jgi:hypothetical protein